MNTADHQLHCAIVRALELALSNNITFESEARVSNWVAKLTIVKTASQPVQISTLESNCSPCEQDILDLLGLEGTALSGTQILAKLETSQKYHGESTVRHALASLTNRGILMKAKGNRGYVMAN